MADDTLPLGKLPVPLLRQFLNGLPGDNPDVVVGPGIGEDAAVIRFGETMLVFKTDPITFAVDDIAWYLVTINANDIACMGGIPEYLLVTFLLPQGSTTPQSAQALFSSLTSACERNAVTLVGGHTEITRGIDRPIAIGFMVGTLSQHGVIRSSDARPGDAILLSKGIPIEATSLLAREFPGKLGLDDAALRRAQNLIYDPGISITRDALIALSCGGVTAMHDPTEGGLATGLHELAYAAGTGVRLHADRVPLLPEGARLCAELGLDPLGAIASGALIVAVDPHEAGALAARYAAAGIPCAHIADLVPREEGLTMMRDNRVLPLPRFDADEVTKVF